MSQATPPAGRFDHLRGALREFPALLWSFLYFFFLLTGYYVLRPVRDAMGAANDPSARNSRVIEINNPGDHVAMPTTGDKTTALEVPTITLTDLLTAHRIERFDLLSLDIELAEPKALAAFDIERFRPALICVEAHPEVRQQLLDYFHQHGYVVASKYLRMDEKNLYFMPAGHPLKPLPADLMATWTDH